MVNNIKKIIKALCGVVFCIVVAVGIPQVARAAEVVINNTNFPDKAFRNYVSNEFDKDNDGKLSNREIITATEIYIHGVYGEIKDLKGVEYFTALRILDCSSNQITKLDLSNNVYLQKLWCFDNQLTELDLSNNIYLKVLGCGLNQLTKLNIVHNTELIYLDCVINKLTELDISYNIKLQDWWCFNNPLTTLKLNNQVYDKLPLYKGYLHGDALTYSDVNLSDLNNVIEYNISDDEFFHYDAEMYLYKNSLIKVIDITKPATYKVNGKDFTIIYVDTTIIPSTGPFMPTVTPEPENTGNPDGLSNKLLLEQMEVEKNVSIKKGSSRKLELTLPYGVTVVDKFTDRYGEVKVGYYSNNEDVATVNQNGYIKAKKKGTADITTIITFENHMSKVFTTKVKVEENKKSVVTKKKMKNLCDDLLLWFVVKIFNEEVKSGEKVTYQMSNKIRGEIITQNFDYINLWAIHNKDYYLNYKNFEDKWNTLSLKFFGKKTPNVQKPFLSEWGDIEPFIKNIKIKANGKNKYKVKADLYVRYYWKSKPTKEGNVIIDLKKNDKSSYGAAITKISVHSLLSRH